MRASRLVGSRAGQPERSRLRRPTRQRFLCAVRRHRPPRLRNARRRPRKSAPTCRLLAPLTRAIRTYSSTGGVELVPGIAQEFGLRVTVGAWIDKHQDRNEREIRSVIDLAKRHSNVNGIIVGNETDLPRRADGFRPDPDDPARQARDQSAGHHRRNLARLDRASRTGLGGRLHRRAYPALLGRLFRQARPSIRRS